MVHDIALHYITLPVKYIHSFNFCVTAPVFDEIQVKYRTKSSCWKDYFLRLEARASQGHGVKKEIGKVLFNHRSSTS